MIILNQTTRLAGQPETNSRGLARTQVLRIAEPAARPPIEPPRPGSFDCARFMRSLRMSALS